MERRVFLFIRQKPRIRRWGDEWIAPGPGMSDNRRMNGDLQRWAGSRALLSGLSKSKALLICLQLAFTATFVIAALKIMNIRLLAGLIEGARPGPLVLAVGIQLFLIYLNALKLRVLLKNDSPSASYLFRINLMKIFFNNSLPGGMAGDVTRVYYLGKEIGSWEKSAAVVFFDRITSQSAMALSILVALIARQKPGDHWTSNAALVLVGAAFIGVLIHTLVVILGKLNFTYLESFRFLDKIRMRINGQEFRKFFLGLMWNWKTLFQVAAICVASQTIWIARLACIVWALGAKVDITILPIALGFGSLLSLLPISLGGIGLNEGAFALVFGMAGSTKELGLGVAALQRLTNFVPATLGWLQYLQGNEKVPRAAPVSARSLAGLDNGN
jgi:uncharacterized protein (TIRG00374 family)